MTKETFNQLYYSKKCNVTNKESGYKYTLLFQLDKLPMTVKGYYIDNEEIEIVYDKDALEDETADEFIKRIKKDVQTHEDL